MVSIGLVTSALAYLLDYEDLSMVEAVMVVASFLGCIAITNPNEEI